MHWTRSNRFELIYARSALYFITFELHGSLFRSHLESFSLVVLPISMSICTYVCMPPHTYIWILLHGHLHTSRILIVSHPLLVMGHIYSYSFVLVLSLPILLLSSWKPSSWTKFFLPTNSNADNRSHLDCQRFPVFIKFAFRNLWRCCYFLIKP